MSWNTFTNPFLPSRTSDLVVLRWAYKRVRELARRMKFFRGYLELGHPQFPSGSAAATDKEKAPVPLDAPKIAYTKEDDDAIDEYHRQTGIDLSLLYSLSPANVVFHS